MKRALVARCKICDSIWSVDMDVNDQNREALESDKVNVKIEYPEEPIVMPEICSCWTSQTNKKELKELVGAVKELTQTLLYVFGTVMDRIEHERRMKEFDMTLNSWLTKCETCNSPGAMAKGSRCLICTAFSEYQPNKSWRGVATIWPQIKKGKQ